VSFDVVTLGTCFVHLPLAGRGPIRAVRAVRTDPGTAWVELPSDAEPPRPGTRVVLDGPWDARLLGTVSEADGRRLRVAVMREQPKDRRDAPRSVGGVELRYMLAHDEAEVDPWIMTGAVPEGRLWLVPDPFMSFSSSGLRFEHGRHVRIGELLLIALSLPRLSIEWRGTARVVRVNMIPDGELRVFAEDPSPATHRIAIHFDSLPKDAREALLKRGLEIQRALSTR
jgi:hypothetical protein